jgi:hypothetical protein
LRQVSEISAVSQPDLAQISSKQAGTMVAVFSSQRRT